MRWLWWNMVHTNSFALLKGSFWYVLPVKTWYIWLCNTSFPSPPWLKQLQQLTGLGETELSAYETLHIVNTLEQLVRGYFCGSNDAKWKGHLFSYARKPLIDNVLNYFYRFEFQKRGTVIIHMLVWLKSIQKISLQNIRADIPWADEDSAYLATVSSPPTKNHWISMMVKLGSKMKMVFLHLKFATLLKLSLTERIHLDNIYFFY